MKSRNHIKSTYPTSHNLYEHRKLYTMITHYSVKRYFTGFDRRPCKYKLYEQAALDEFKLIYSQHKAIQPVMPGKGDILKFKQ